MRPVQERVRRRLVPAEGAIDHIDEAPRLVATYARSGQATGPGSVSSIM